MLRSKGFITESDYKNEGGLPPPKSRPSCGRNIGQPMRLRQINAAIWFALIAGVVLAVMTDWNSQLARHSSPLFASWIAHGVGAGTSTLLVLLFSLKSEAKGCGKPHESWPLWTYLGGVPGAFTVLLAAITVNSALGLAGTLALLLVGQMAFGVLADYFGLFLLQRRRLQPREVAGFALVLIGSIAIILARS